MVIAGVRKPPVGSRTGEATRAALRRGVRGAMDNRAAGPQGRHGHRHGRRRGRERHAVPGRAPRALIVPAAVTAVHRYGRREPGTRRPWHSYRARTARAAPAGGRPRASVSVSRPA
ncbi:hypothetical protein GCM10010524_37510 [Streptomyces mexicanus]